MVVNSHLTAQQAGALAGLEGLQAVAWGSPAPRGTRVRRGFAPGGAGRPAGAAGHGGAQRLPAAGKKKDGERAGKQEQRPGSRSLGEAQRQGSGNGGECAPQGPMGAAPNPARATASLTQPGALTSGPFLGPADLRFLGPCTRWLPLRLRTLPPPPAQRWEAEARTACAGLHWGAAAPQLRPSSPGEALPLDPAVSSLGRCTHTCVGM